MNRLKGNLLLVLATAIPLTLSAQLNPTVKVLPRPTAPVPAECDQGLAPQPAQRLTTEERTIVRDTRADMQAPPSAGLRGELQTAVAAAQRNNREVFRDAMARASDILATYPPGAERDSGKELMTVLSDIDTVWNFQFTSPTGAFFDSSSDSFRVASRYTGYDAFIRKQILVDQNGNRFYPTRETLDFLTNEAASRLSRLTGKPAPARPAPRGMVVTPPSHRRPVVKSGGQESVPVPGQTKSPVVHTPRTTTTKHVVGPPHPKQHTTKAAATKHVQPVTPAPKHEAAKSVTKKESTSTPTKAETVARPPIPKHEAPAVVAKKEPAPSAPRKSEPTATVIPAHSSATSPSATTSRTTTTSGIATTSTSATTAPTTRSTATTTSAPTITTPTDTMSSAPATATESAATTDTSATTSAESTTTGKPAQSRSFFWPIFLIIVGLGVLVMLWRASS